MYLPIYLRNTKLQMRAVAKKDDFATHVFKDRSTVAIPDP
jgi:hypothetical protein